jgi:hypothetical protein
VSKNTNIDNIKFNLAKKQLDVFHTIQNVTLRDKSSKF